MEEENLLADIPREGEELDLDSVEKELQEETEEENPAESLPEKLDLPDEDNLAIQKRNSAFEEMRTAREEAERKATELEERLSALEKEDSLEKSEFVQSLVGENEDVEKVWAKEKQSLKEQLKQELVQEQEQAQEQEQKEKEHWINWTNERLSEVEQEFKVDFSKDESKKNELSKVMLEYSPTDEQGNLDYRKGYRILQDLGKAKEAETTQKTQVKKNIADATVSKETSVKENKDFYTSSDLRKGWR